MPNRSHQDRLKVVGLKATRARVAVLESLARARVPISAQEIAERVGTQSADQATVYRIVQAFLEAGILREVNLRHGHIDYELTDAEDHHHVVCTACGRVEAFASCDAETLIRAALKSCPSFARIDEHAIELFGTCRSCTPFLLP